MNPWDNIGQLGKSEIRELQNRKLHHFVNHYLYPFSPFYHRLFDQHKIDPQKIRTIDDLRRIPFTSKNDLVKTDEEPEKFKTFILQPDQAKIRQYWPKSQLAALGVKSALQGKEAIQYDLVQEFKPIFITFTTGTTQNPISFMYTKYDIRNLHTSGHRMLQLFDVKDDRPLLNMFPYAPHLAFWQVFLAVSNRVP